MTRWMFLAALAVSIGCSSEAQRQKALALEASAVALVAAHPDLPLARGRQIYAAQCASCHQLDGLGTKNAIPPLAGHVPFLLRAEGGRSYLAGLVLYGAAGEVSVLGRTYHNQMPSLGALLKDADVAAALAFVSLAWGNEDLLAKAPLVSPQDVLSMRGRPHRAKDTLSKRPQLP